MASKYDPLRDYLYYYKKREVLLGFKQIEGIIGDELPWSAYNLRQWWENSMSPNRRHVQAIAWTNAGWKVDWVDFNSRQVCFKRYS